MKIIFLDSQVEKIKAALELGKGKHQLFYCSTEADLWKELTKTTFDVVAIDYDNTSTFTGEQVNLKIKEKFPQILRVIMAESKSAKFFRDHQRSEAGADGYFKKPFTSEDFFEVVNEFSVSTGQGKVDVGINGGSVIINVKDSGEIDLEEELNKDRSAAPTPAPASATKTSKQPSPAPEPENEMVLDTKNQAPEMTITDFDHAELDLGGLEEVEMLQMDSTAPDSDDKTQVQLENLDERPVAPAIKNIDTNDLDLDLLDLPDASQFTSSNISVSDLNSKKEELVDVEFSPSITEETVIKNDLFNKEELEKVVPPPVKAAPEKKEIEPLEIANIDEQEIDVDQFFGSESKIIETNLSGLDEADDKTKVASGEDIANFTKSLNAKSDDEESKTIVGSIDFNQLSNSNDTSLSSYEDEDKTRIASTNDLSFDQSKSNNSFSGNTDETLTGHHHGEMVRLQSTIRQLRDEREQLLKKIDQFRSDLENIKSDNLGLRSENDEIKVENSILKKRIRDEVEKMRIEVQIAQDKKDIAYEKNKKMHLELERLKQKSRIDVGQIRHREKELESQLELIKSDSQAQISSRENKIMELKRKIDALEFNMESVSISEQRSREERYKIEEKMRNVVNSLSDALNILEEENIEIDDKVLFKNVKI